MGALSVPPLDQINTQHEFKKKEEREKERCIIYKEEKEIYIVQEIDVCSLVPFLFSFSSMKLPIFVSIPLSNVNISLRGLALDPSTFLVFVLLFSHTRCSSYR